MRKLGLYIVVGLAIALAGPAAQAQVVTSFYLQANPAELACLRNGAQTPVAQVVIAQGTLTDDLAITVSGLKPNKAFDLFTVQNSRFLSTGALDPAFKNFGLAWYQTDLETNSVGRGFATLHTILINQIFGFDPALTPPLPPTNTFHVGFWFNNPADSCTHAVTPFNGEHNAGPLAMISLPNATTKLGPLCQSPVFSGGVWKCNP